MNSDVLVLLSGGVDSAACVNFYKDMGVEVCGIFIDYGQPSAKYEAVAATAISSYYSINLLKSSWKGHKKKLSGFINGRNIFLIAAALMECPPDVLIIALGIHKGTNYQDCSLEFLNKTQEIVNLYGNGQIELSAPFVDFTKREILSYCLNKNVPIELTYSCETGGKEPCGKCLSCKDKEMLNACT